MKPEDQLDFALGRLDTLGRSMADAELLANPDLAARVDRLGPALHRLLDDGRSFEPPAGLADRTIAFVADRKARRNVLDFVPARVPFRWADVAVAAGILLAGLLTLLPAIQKTRDQMTQAGCAFNLQQLGIGLANYATRHNHYPDVHSRGADSPVGAYALALDDENLLHDPRALHCPCRGKCPAEGHRPDPGHIDYAYHIGYRPQLSAESEPVSPWLTGPVPLLADQPPHDAGRVALEGNSPNHANRGQNVLFSDLHIQWFPTRRISPVDDDLFLNALNRPEPGVGVHDAALVPAVFRVAGH